MDWFRQIVDTAPDAMVVVNAAGIIAYANGEAERLFGYTRAELVGKALDVLMPERFRAAHAAHMKRFLKEPRARPMGGGLDLVGLTRDGREIPIDVSLGVLDTAEGVLVAAAIRDMSERRRIEAELLEAQRAALRAAASPAAVPRPVVLYIEDNASNVDLIRDLLGAHPEVELTAAATAEVGLEIARTRRPKVILMDINLPGMSGFDALQQLRAWPETKDIPVVALTATARERDRQIGKAAGFYRYLAKPVKIDEVEATLDELLGNGAPAG